MNYYIHLKILDSLTRTVNNPWCFDRGDDTTIAVTKDNKVRIKVKRNWFGTYGPLSVVILDCGTEVHTATFHQKFEILRAITRAKDSVQFSAHLNQNTIISRL